MEIATDKIDRALIEGFFGASDNLTVEVMIPKVGGFGVVDPGAGQKTKTKVLGFTVKTTETKMRLRPE